MSISSRRFESQFRKSPSFSGALSFAPPGTRSIRVSKSQPIDGAFRFQHRASSMLEESGGIDNDSRPVGMYNAPTRLAFDKYPLHL
ncbi:hypothetical protein OIU34_39010 [Pararhizobium sp. BT-229]|uniref:hypothetical protein n=1 Tax=Pararhizobium sp. BT-229 TaxID=2986923 RepID=UPI0021F78721|nr:hypothetical protein [Pararhizobium sp. BT-229]MCV9967801.1 hypothetical protein [Pararhizobium sp. BT-229]